MKPEGEKQCVILKAEGEKEAAFRASPLNTGMRPPECPE
jgi:hypothetical protein